MASYTDVGPRDALQPGDRTVVEVDDREVLVFNYEGTYHAVANSCPHQGWSLQDGEIRDGVITCPLHRGSFDVETGDIVGPPPEEPIQCYEVVVNQDSIRVKH